MSGYLSNAQSHVLIKKVAAPNVQERIDALNQIDKVLLERANSTGIARRYFKGLSMNDTAGEGMRIVTPADEFYDTLTEEKPSVVYYIQPDPRKEIFAPKGGAVTVGADGSPRVKPFAGQRYVESFDTLQTDGRFKDIKELFAYPYDIVTFFENYSNKDLLDREDFLFFRLINHLLYEGRTTLASKNIMVANEATFSVLMFSYLKDQHKNKQVPFSRLISHFSVLNSKERTVESEIKDVAYEGINGQTSMDNMFGMTPLSLDTKEFCYFSFNVANADLEDEKEQSYIDLSLITARNIAEMYAAADKETQSELIKDYMEGIGYKWNGMTSDTAAGVYGTGYEFCRFLDADNFLPRIPIYGADYTEATGGGNYKAIVAILGKSMIRSYVLAPRAYFGHFDLFLEDAKTIVERNNKRIMFYSEEEMIMTAKNGRAVTALDIWRPVLPFVA